jgi:hypothetical protein
MDVEVLTSFMFVCFDPYSLASLENDDLKVRLCQCPFPTRSLSVTREEAKSLGYSHILDISDRRSS